MAQSILYYLPQKGVFQLQTDAGTTDIAVDKAEIARGSFSSALDDALEAESTLREPISVDFILPHFMYGIDYITLPNIKKSLMEDAYKAQLQSSYKNYNDLIFQKTEIHTGKTVTYRVLFMRRTLLTEIKEGFAKFGITIGRVIPQGVALFEGVINHQPVAKRIPFAVLNIGEDSSYMAAYGPETLLGGLPIPFGLRALSSAKVVHEKQLFRRDAAELLVINAKERAKSTKLTMAINLEEENIDESIPGEEEEVIEQNPDLPDLTVAGSEEATQAAPPEEEEEDLPPAVKTLRRSAIRVLPKFMRRELPTTPEGFVVENFRLFERRILMLLREMALTDYFPKIEYVYLALPEGYDFLIEELKTANPTINWVYLTENDDSLLISGAQRVGQKAEVF